MAHLHAAKTLASIFFLYSARCFLLDDNQKAGQITVPPHDDYHDLVQLIVEEKTLRYRLETIVDNLSKHVSKLESAFTELHRKCDSCSANVSSASDIVNIKSDVGVLQSQISTTNQSLAELFRNQNNLSATVRAQDTLYKTFPVGNPMWISTTNQSLAELFRNQNNLSATVRAQDIVNIKSDVGVLQSQISTTNQSLAELFRNQNNLSATVRAQDIVNIKSDVGVLQSQISTTNQSLAELFRNQNNLSATVRAQDIANLRSDVGILQGQISTTNRSLAELFRNRQNLSTLVTSQGAGYFFTATEPDIWNTEKFKKIITNIGGSYNQSTGKFVCKRPGIYMFSFTVGSKLSSETFCWIQKNSKDTMLSDAFTGDSTLDMASNIVFLELNVGDIVDLGQCENWGHFDHETSFSGGSILLF